MESENLKTITIELNEVQFNVINSALIQAVMYFSANPIVRDEYQAVLDQWHRISKLLKD